MIRHLANICFKTIKLQQPPILRILNTRSRYYMCQGRNQMDQKKQQLDQLYTQFYSEQDLDQRLILMKQVMEIKQSVNEQLLGREGTYYQGHRRDTLVLAQIHLQQGKKEESLKLIEQIMQGDYTNEFPEHKDENEAYLAELYIMNCMANLNNLQVAEEAGLKAMDHLQYFIEHHCPIYKSVTKEEPIPENADLDAELQSIQNLVQHLQLVAKITQERGKLEESLQHLGYKATILDNQGHLFRKILSKEVKVKTEMKDQELQRFFMGIVVSQAITLKNLGRACILLRRYEDSKSLIQTAVNYFDFLIETKLITNSDDNYVAALIENYNLIKESTNNEQELLEIQNKLENNLSNLEENEESLYTLLEYELFKVKYQKVDLTKLNELIKKLDDDVPSLLDYNRARITYMIGHGQLDQALAICKQQIDNLNQYFDSSHFLFGETCSIAVDLSLQLNDFTQAKQYIQLINQNAHNLSYFTDLENRMKIKSLQLQFQEQLNQNNKQHLQSILDKIEEITLSSYQNAFDKSYLLSNLCSLLGDKSQQKSKLGECLNILATQQAFPQKEQVKQQIQQQYDSI